eukprot:m.239561 g.239561  ORF g.239561 m.239561 type:complete len:622 (-) comp13498_c0_seq1:3332-5197(-)
MTDRGAHGDGRDEETHTPLVAWGAGVARLDGLQHVEQADIAPLLAALLGTAPPVNSVGLLPASFLDADAATRAVWLITNAEQILRNYARKEWLRASTTVLFHPFAPLAHNRGAALLQRAVDLHATGVDEECADEARSLIRLCLAGMRYYETYHRRMLLAFAVAGQVAWIAYVVLVGLAPSPASSKNVQPSSLIGPLRRANGALGAGLLALLLVQRSPLTYYAYLAQPCALINAILAQPQWQPGWQPGHPTLFVARFAAAALILLLLVLSFFARGCAGVAGLAAAVWVVCETTPCISSRPSSRPQPPPSAWRRYRGLLASQLGLGLCTMLPAGLDWRGVLLVPFVGPAVLIAGAYHSLAGRARMYVLQRWIPPLLMAALICIYSDQSILAGQSLPWPLQALAWTVLFVPTAMSGRGGLGVAAAQHAAAVGGEDVAVQTVLIAFWTAAMAVGVGMCLLSIGYEAVFYGLLACSVSAWLSVLPRAGTVPESSARDAAIAMLGLSLTFLAFFGTGTVASVSSFDVTSVFRLLVSFAPFPMAALLLVKVLAPVCLAQAVASHACGRPLPWLLVYGSVLASAFLFLVRDEGSWKDIGQSIAHFVIVSFLFVALMPMGRVMQLLLRPT